MSRQTVVSPRYTSQIPKRPFQALLTQCRHSGFDVVKKSDAYFVYDGDDLILRALDMRRNYFVTASKQHFEPDYDVADALTYDWEI